MSEKLVVAQVVFLNVPNVSHVGKPAKLVSLLNKYNIYLSFYALLRKGAKKLAADEYNDKQNLRTPKFQVEPSIIFHRTKLSHSTQHKRPSVLFLLSLSH